MAKPITQNIYTNSIGVLNNAHDQATIINNQDNSVNINLSKVESVISEIERVKALLPSDKIPAIDQNLAEIKLEMSQDIKNQSKIKSAFGSIKNICEGITGNVVAQGIISAISSI